nr:exopolyphosphatase [Desulfuromonadales bacterium]NIS41823.1 exopolyphosphatase [Desulfuromonadales bacterium]
PEAMNRTLQALDEFSEAMRDAGTRRVRAVGTEALRKAVNGRDEFAERVEAQTGLALDIIDGEEEARLSAAGVLAALSPQPEQCLIFDIGGGSTEFILVEAGKVRFHKSYPLGVVRLAEGVGRAELPSAIESILHRFSRDLSAASVSLETGNNLALVGTAGTVTTLAAIDMEMVDYDWRRVNNHQLDRQELDIMYRRLLPLSAEQREEIAGMEKGRGDLIVPGLTIVRMLMEQVGCSRLTVSDFGLLEGVLIDLDRKRSH